MLSVPWTRRYAGLLLQELSQQVPLQVCSGVRWVPPCALYHHTRGQSAVTWPRPCLWARAQCAQLSDVKGTVRPKKKKSKVSCLNNWRSWGLALSVHTAHLACNPSLQNSHIDLKRFYLRLVLTLEFFTVSAKLKVWARTSSEVDSCLKKGVKKVFCNQFRIMGLPETCIMLDDLYRAIFCSCIFSAV